MEKRNSPSNVFLMKNPTNNAVNIIGKKSMETNTLTKMLRKFVELLLLNGHKLARLIKSTSERMLFLKKTHLRQ